MYRKFKLFGIVLVLTISLLAAGIAWAGGTQDFGTLLGSPSQANYVAWLDSDGTPPARVLTEDGYNPVGGTDNGYQSGTWILSADNFNPAPIDGDGLNFIFGGLGSDAGTLWDYSAVYDNDAPYTDHGEVTSTSMGQCPVMTQGSQNGTGKTINWTGTASEFLIYRSLLPSGADNGHSNGLYEYVASVSGSTFTYLDTACATGTDCWHIVVPANGSGVINGCHSEESNPTAVQLIEFNTRENKSNNYTISISLGALFAASIGLVWVLRWRLNLQKN